MQLISRLNDVIAEFHLLKHKFYQMWSSGELTQAQLQRYAMQYYHQVKSFPRFISRVHTHCPEMEAGKILVKNLTEEVNHGTDHPSLWRQFGEGMGATHEAMLNEVPFAETETMVNKYYELAERDWRDGLCALYAYEYQVPEVSASKIAGLKAFYNIDDQSTLEFFTAHQVYDVEHSQEVAGLIERYCEVEQAQKATREAAIALWGFLDGMCRETGIVC